MAMFVNPYKVFAIAETPEPIRRKKVGIVMGSPNDYAKMRDAEDVLHRFGIETRVRASSTARGGGVCFQRARERILGDDLRSGDGRTPCGRGVGAHDVTGGGCSFIGKRDVRIGRLVFDGTNAKGYSSGHGRHRQRDERRNPGDPNVRDHRP